MILKPATLLYFHHAVVKRKYRLLYSPRKRRRPGPEGPSKELIAAVVEMKRRKHRTREPSATDSLLLRRLAYEAGRTHLV